MVTRDDVVIYCYNLAGKTIKVGSKIMVEIEQYILTSFLSQTRIAFFSPIHHLISSFWALYLGMMIYLS